MANEAKTNLPKLAREHVLASVPVSCLVAHGKPFDVMTRVAKEKADPHHRVNAEIQAGLNESGIYRVPHADANLIDEPVTKPVELRQVWRTEHRSLVVRFNYRSNRTRKRRPPPLNPAVAAYETPLVSRRNPTSAAHAGPDSAHGARSYSRLFSRRDVD
jgi:hypothetical protein